MIRLGTFKIWGPILSHILFASMVRPTGVRFAIWMSSIIMPRSLPACRVPQSSEKAWVQKAQMCILLKFDCETKADIQPCISHLPLQHLLCSFHRWIQTHARDQNATGVIQLQEGCLSFRVGIFPRASEEFPKIQMNASKGTLKVDSGGRLTSRSRNMCSRRLKLRQILVHGSQQLYAQ